MILLTSCVGSRISFKSPANIETSREYSQIPTELNVPISINLEGLKSLLKNEFPNPLTESSGHTEINVPYIVLEMTEKLVEEVYSWVEKIPVVNLLSSLVKDVVKTGTRMVKKIVPTEIEKI